MTQVVDIVSRALRVLRVVDPDEAVEGRPFNNGMTALNAMIGAWEAYGRALGWSPVSNPADDMPTPPEFDEAIAYNLACKLRPEYGVSLDPDTIDFAKSGLALIRTSVEANTYARLELDLPRAESERCLDGGAGFYRGLVMRPIDLIGGYYRDSSIPQSRQDTVNWIPEVAQATGTRTQWKLRGAPGLDLLLDIAGASSTPIRVGGSHAVEGQLFVVCGTQLIEIDPSGNTTVRGTIPGVGPVYMSHNQRSTGNELLIENGTSSGYVWNTATGTFTTISDEAHVGGVSADYLDSYFIIAEPFGRFWYHSDLANGLAYNSLDRYESEASPDKIVCTRVNQFEVVAFNETTIEFFGNTGAATNTFQSKRIVIEVGCAGRNTVVKIAGTLAWLGNDGQFYALANYQAVPISTDAEVKAIKGLNWSQAFATIFKDDSHEIAYWTFPDGQTFGFDFSTKLWHRRESYGLDRWRLNTLTFWNGQWIGGDFQRGRLYVLNWDTYTENGAPLVAERVTGPLHGDQSWFNITYAELIFDTGTAAFGVDHEALLSYADDNGHNFKNWKARSLGLRGQYGKRVRYHQLGQTLNRVWRIRVASNGKRDLLGAVLQAEGVEPMSYLVVDNFCEDPERVKQSAFAAGFDTWRPNKGEVGSSIYEGMGFWGDHSLMLRGLMRAVGGIVVPNTMFFRVTNVGMEKAYIHSDRESGNHTCVAYLTDHAEDSGTAFFMHKRTGLRAMPSFQEMSEAGILDELKADMVSRDPDKWVQTDYVRGSYNRALIFPAPLFHSRFPLEGIGDSPDTGRLVWASHFFKVNNAGEFF